MKIKLISLIAALLCLTLFLVSCDSCTNHTDADKNGVCDTCEDTIEWPKSSCTNHVDADGDGVCDTEDCDVVIQINTVTNTVEIPVANPLEEKVEMVVKPIPTDAVLSEYFSYDYTTNTITLYVSPVTSIKNADVYAWQSDIRYWVKTTAEITPEVPDDEATEDVNEFKPAVMKDTYKLFDINLNKDIIVLEKEYDKGDEPSFITHKYGVNDDLIYVLFAGRSNYYTNSGEAVVLNSDVSVAGEVSTTDANVLYLDFAGKTYAVDTNTDKLIYTEYTDLFVKRPVFDAVVGTYGYVLENNNKFYVYDTSAWISLVWTYEIPENDDYDTFELANGNIVLQCLNKLPDNAVNYDYVVGGTKYDIKHIIVDFVNKTAVNVEFGYFIANESDFADGYRTDKTQNVFSISAIKDGKLLSDRMITVLDNELNILCVYDKFVLGQTVKSYTLVADNLFLVQIDLGDDYVVDALADANGTVVKYLSEAYSTTSGFAVLNNNYNVIYNVDLSVRIDFAKDGYEIVKRNGDVFLLRQEVNTAPEGEPEVIVEKFYIYNASKDAAPVEITGIAAFTWTQSNYVFVTSVATEVPVDPAQPDLGMTTVVKYQVRDYNNNVIMEVASLEGGFPPAMNVYSIGNGMYELRVWSDTFGLSGVYTSYYFTTTAPAPVEPAPAA